MCLREEAKLSITCGIFLCELLPNVVCMHDSLLGTGLESAKDLLNNFEIWLTYCATMIKDNS